HDLRALLARDGRQEVLRVLGVGADVLDVGAGHRPLAAGDLLQREVVARDEAGALLRLALAGAAALAHARGRLGRRVRLVPGLVGLDVASPAAVELLHRPRVGAHARRAAGLGRALHPGGVVERDEDLELGPARGGEPGVDARALHGVVDRVP